jgi:iron complex transport system substrate-binding protein
MFQPRAAWLCRVAIFLTLAASCSTPHQQSAARTPQRIISVVPNVTEMLFALGLGDRVIAVSSYDEYPPEVVGKPRVGALLNPNIEKIIEMHPDLVITYGSQELLRQRLEAAGIRMFGFTHGNVEHTLKYMLDLGRTVGAEEQAERLVQDIRQTFDELRQHAPPERPKVLLVHERRAGVLGAFYSIGSRAFQHDLIGIAGGRNLFSDVDSETIQPTLEQIISRHPDIVLETLPPPLNSAEAAERRSDWKTIGIPESRVHIEAESYLLVPGPRMAIAARRIAEIIHAVP